MPRKLNSIRFTSLFKKAENLFEGAEVTNQFKNTNGGDWFTASNWSENSVPTAAEDVSINFQFFFSVFDQVTIVGQAAVAHNIDVVNNVLCVGTELGVSPGSLTANLINLNASRLLIGGSTVGDFQHSGQLTVSDHIQLQSTDSAVVFNSDDNFTFSAFIRGSGSLEKDGLDVVTMASGVGNNYSGGTTINGGALRVQNNAGALSAGGTTIKSGASLLLENAGQYNVAVTLSGNGFDGKGAVQSLAGLNEFGVVDDTLGADARVNASVGSTFIFDGAIALSGHTLTLGGGGSFTVDDILADTGGVTIDGGTIVSFVDDDLYTGATNIKSGVLKLSVANEFQGGSAVGVSAAGTLDVVADNTIGSLLGQGKVILEADTLSVGSNGLPSVFGGVISDGTGPGHLTKVGARMLALTGANTYTGGTILQSGVLAWGNFNAIGTGVLTFAASSKFEAIITDTVVNDITVAAGVSATIGATAGKTVTLSSANINLGANASLHFGAAVDVGVVWLDLVGFHFSGNDRLYVDGGTLFASSTSTPNQFNLLTRVNVATNAGSSATLDTVGNAETLRNLSGGAGAKIISSTGASSVTIVGGAYAGTFGSSLQVHIAQTVQLSGADPYAGHFFLFSGATLNLANYAGSGSPQVHLQRTWRAQRQQCGGRGQDLAPRKHGGRRRCRQGRPRQRDLRDRRLAGGVRFHQRRRRQ